MCSNKIEYEETRIAIRRFLPTRYTFGFVALDSAMINAIICNPHLPHHTYDNAGNLVEESNPLGKIFYDYTYYRVLNKRYSSMTGNNVTYTYGTSGTERGRPIHISDGSGSHELTYDALGNVTAETRIIVLPNSQEEFSLRRGGCSVAPCCSRWSGFAVQPNSVTGFAICITIFDVESIMRLLMATTQ